MLTKWVFAAIIAAASVALGAEILSFWFTGIDAFPLILSSRANSAADLFGLFGREHLGAYSGQQIAGAVGVRPLPMISFAVNRWISDLTPFGFHLTNLLIHTCNAILIFLLAQQLKLRHAAAVGLVGALIFLINPLQPNIIASIEIRFELLMGTFVLLAVLCLLRHLEANSGGWLAASLLSAVLALLCKGSAILLFPMMSWAVLVVVANRPDRTVRRFAVPLAGLATVTLIYLIYRYWVLFGMGGYPPKEITPGHIVFSAWYVPAFFFRMLVMPTAMTFLDGWGLLGKLAWLCLGWGFLLALLATLIATLRDLFPAWRRIPFPRPLDPRFGPDALPIHLLTVWVLAFIPFYWLLHLTTGILQTWYAYVPSAFFSLVLGALVVSGWTALMRSRRAVLAAALPSLVAALYLVPPGSGRFCEWPDASRIARAYLDRLGTALRRVPDGATVFAVNLPHGAWNPSAPCAVGELRGATIFEDYTLDSWLKLTRPGRAIRFAALSTVWVDVRRPLKSRISFDAARRTITVSNSSGLMEPPWFTSAGHDFATDFDASGARLTIRPRPQDARKGERFIIDVFEPRVLFRLAPDGTLHPA